MRAYRRIAVLAAIARVRAGTTAEIAAAAGVSVRVAWPVLRVAADEGLIDQDRNGRDALWLDLRRIDP